MNIVDPRKPVEKKKKPLRGGDPFDAEPGASEPSKSWLDAQAALIVMTVKADERWGNLLPTLDTYSEGVDQEYHFDEAKGKYYWKNYLTFKVSYRYYRGNRKRSYLFWPKHVTPGWSARQIIKRERTEGQIIDVKTDAGWAKYVYLGHVNVKTYYGDSLEVLALWRSDGTMKKRQRRNGGNEPSEDST